MLLICISIGYLLDFLVLYNAAQGFILPTWFSSVESSPAQHEFDLY